MFNLPPALDALTRGAILSVVALVWIIILVRLVGPRSLSKMTSVDFVVTVATGSLLAAAGSASDLVNFCQILAAVSALFLAQFIIAKLRRGAGPTDDLVDNSPVLLAEDGGIFEEALKHTRVTRADLIAKLREANALSMDSVRAVVLESTGDVSVLHGDSFDDQLLEDVRRIDSGGA